MHALNVFEAFVGEKMIIRRCSSLLDNILQSYFELSAQRNGRMSRTKLLDLCGGFVKHALFESTDSDLQSSLL